LIRHLLFYWDGIEIQQFKMMKLCQKSTRLYNIKKPNAGGDHMLDVINVGKTISVGQKLLTHFQTTACIV
jgi:hypothetical protein